MEVALYDVRRSKKLRRPRLIRTRKFPGWNMLTEAWKTYEESTARCFQFWKALNAVTNIEISIFSNNKETCRFAQKHDCLEERHNSSAVTGALCGNAFAYTTVHKDGTNWEDQKTKWMSKLAYNCLKRSKLNVWYKPWLKPSLYVLLSFF